MPTKVTRETFTLSALTASVPKIFEQAQLSTANHRKNFVGLYKLQCQAAKQVEQQRTGVKLTGERMFGEVMLQMIARFLPVKKGATVVDRVIKFISGYVKYINEKVAEKKNENEMNEEDEDEDETIESRFVTRLLIWLFRGFVAKDKTVRYRAVQLVAEMISNLGEIDEDLYHTLRSALLERVTDKEPPIRVQAVIALSKLCGSEDSADIANGELTAIEVLTDVLSYDHSADVRRAALLHIPVVPSTLYGILQRTRDTDTNVRKLVYSTVLDANTLQSGASPKLVGVTHPRALSIAQRELVVRNGLGDREISVKAAARTWIAGWIDLISECEEQGQGEAKLEGQLVKFLGLFDLGEGNIAEDALLSVFESREDVLSNLEFGDAYWMELTPEKAFLARVFVDYCISHDDESRLETVLPVVTSFAFCIQATYNELISNIQAEEMDNFLGGINEEQSTRNEEERLEKEFIIAEMCKLAVNLDYADEIGRRKMFQLIRDMISQESLPDPLVERCLDVLRKLSANERDLIRVVVEVVHDLRDPSDSDEEPAVRDDDGETTFTATPATIQSAPTGHKDTKEKSPEQQVRADAIDLKCLSLCIGMLERVNGTFEENSTLEGILGELIVPAVKQKELALREKGLICLGLCCLIAKRMALNSFQLFISQIQSAPEILKIRVLQIVFDILMVHQGDFLGREGPQSEMITNFLVHVLDNEEADNVQSLLCIGISKLLLAGLIHDERVLKSLVLLYLSPATVDNQELRQCLSYFLPVYCYSSAANQRRMSTIFIATFEHMAEMRIQLGEAVSPAQVAGMFVDWTDPQKVVDNPSVARDNLIHFDLAADIVKVMLSKSMRKEDKKVLCQILGRLHIPDVVDDDKLRMLKLLMHNLRSRRPVKDAASNNTFNRFETSITIKFEKQLEDFNEDEYRKLEELKELFEFLDEIIPEDSEDEDGVSTKKSYRKRRSESIISTTTEGDTAPPRARQRPTRQLKGKTKRRRVSSSTDDSDLTESGRSPTPAVAPTRQIPRRSAAPNKQLVEIDSSEEDDNAEESSSPVPMTRGKAMKSRHAAEEAKLDAEIDALLESDKSELSAPPDSESEEEVNDLLASED